MGAWGRGAWSVLVGRGACACSWSVERARARGACAWSVGACACSWSVERARGRGACACSWSVERGRGRGAWAVGRHVPRRAFRGAMKHGGEKRFGAARTDARFRGRVRQFGDPFAMVGRIGAVLGPIREAMVRGPTNRHGGSGSPRADGRAMRTTRPAPWPRRVSPPPQPSARTSASAAPAVGEPLG